MTHGPTGRIYVGCTSYSADQRWESHKAAHKRGRHPLYDAMRVSALTDFVVTEVAWFPVSVWATRFERQYMNEVGSYWPDGFNLLPNAGGRNPSAYVELTEAGRQ